MGETFIIGDIHFGHHNVLEFGKRPFKTLEEMHENIITLWNGTVTKRDIVICLGDWGWGTKYYKIANELRGMKKLVMGNHDKGYLPNLINNFHSVHGSLRKGDILFTHIPIIFDEYHMWKYVVHGHIHDYRDNIKDWRYYNANMDAIGYYGPINLDTIIMEFKQREYDYMNGEYFND